MQSTSCSHFTKLSLESRKLRKGGREQKFNLDLKVGREVDDVTSAGRLFHIRAATTGNDRSPTVASRVRGTAKAEVDDDRRRCRPVILRTV